MSVSSAGDPHSCFADPDLAVLSMRIRMPLLSKCGSGSSLNNFVKNYLMKKLLQFKN